MLYLSLKTLHILSMVLLFGIVGYLLLRLKFEPAPLLLGFVLGPMVEVNFRRALLLSRGDPMVFIERPISLAFLVLCVLLIAGLLLSSWRSFQRGREAYA